MNFRSSLKKRIIIGLLASSILLSLLLAVTSLAIKADLQTNFIAKTILDDLNSYIKQLSKNPEKTLALGIPISTNVTGILTTPEKLPLELPVHYADLNDGVHEVTEKDKKFIVAVNKSFIYKNQPLWGFVKYDVTHISKDNMRFFLILSGVFMLFIFMTYVLAKLVSEKALKPLSELAARLDSLGNDVHPEKLTPYFPDDEVGKVAMALDAYAQRLTDYVIRDKEFNADVSHELRTPLAVIASTTELLKSSKNLTQKELDRVDRIDRAVRQSTELTETLLLLAREEKQQKNALERAQAGQIVRKIIEMHQQTLKMKALTIKVMEKDWLQIDAPDSVVSVALSNLIGNAIKYTHDGIITITIDQNSVTVSDQGQGVDESELPKLFDRHFRANKTTGKGSGLGLAIVKRLCDLYNWKIEIKPNKVTGLSAQLTF